jgi:peptide/nickel transport system substrate-binding protein
MRYTFQTVQGWTDWLAAAEILRQNLAEVGVAVTVKTLEYNAWD